MKGLLFRRASTYTRTAWLRRGRPKTPLPEIHQLMREVEQHQREMDKVRENYTYTALQTTQNLDSSGQ